MNNLLMLSTAVFLIGGMVISHSRNDAEITVGIGEAQMITETGVEIKFVEVLEDSRCPEGVNCIWEGNARIRIEVNRYHKTRVLYELDTNGPATSIDFDRFRITLKSLDPYPQAETAVNRPDYKATLTIADSE